MTDTIDLQIGIYLLVGDNYRVEVRFDNPDEATMVEPVNGLTSLEPAALKLLLDPVKYGQTLSKALFADPHVLTHFQEGRAIAAQNGKILRIRLFIDRSAIDLHNLRWETLSDPVQQTWMLSDERTPFSRFLSNSTWERVQLRAKGSLRGLAMIANPINLADYAYEVGGKSLPPLDVESELAIVRSSLTGITMNQLFSDPLKPGQASLSRLMGELRQGYDILYLVAHGAYLTKVESPGPYLWLEGDDGRASVTSGVVLAEAIQKLSADRRPRLIVLASCQSAGAGEAYPGNEALSALGARLIEAGVPAVLAMQGNISLTTIDQFMSVFFQELSRDGLIDRAVAVARSQVSARADAWMPVLLMQLRDGCLWYTPGFTGDRPGFDRWPGFIKSLQQKICTPIIGPAMSEFLIGDSRQIARQWAEKVHIR